MPLTTGSLALEIEEQLRKADIDALEVALKDAHRAADVADLLAHFIGFPRLLKYVDESLRRIYASGTDR